MRRRAASTLGPAQAATLAVNYDFIAGAVATALAPDTPPPGANNWSCQLTAAHPDPVILVHGTFATMDDNWQAASPLLANNGTAYVLRPPSAIQGTGDIAASAAQLATFVSTVLAATGASKVDLVGHSQGGMMPRYYINFLGGASKVNDFVALAPSNYGTSLAASPLPACSSSGSTALTLPGLGRAGARIGVPRHPERDPDRRRPEVHRDRERR